MTAATEKAAPIPAEDAARILIAALREYGQEDNRAGEAENMGRHAAVRGMMVRLGLYPEFCKALDADATEDEVAALLAVQASQEERIREDERAPETVDALEGLFWLELREPGLVPQRKGPWPHARTKDILREFMKANPSAYISVVTISHDGPWFDDAPETLGIVDGRCWPTARKHIASSSAAHARLRGGAS